MEKKDKLVERKILTFSSLKSPTAIDESLNEKRIAATVAVFNTKFFNFLNFFVVPILFKEYKNMTGWEGDLFFPIIYVNAVRKT